MDSVITGTIGGTYCGNPLSCAAALKVMEIMKAEDFCTKAMHLGEKVMKAYEGFKDKYSVVGDVRGLGAMIGIEFVKDRGTKEPYTEFVSHMIQSALQKGLMLENAGSAGNVIRFLAPLTMTDAQTEAGLAIFEDSLVETMQKFGI
jgi:4-aminobutyrate aminotransferase/(S)-3-amino-2-methylpropionate transaminase